MTGVVLFCSYLTSMLHDGGLSVPLPGALSLQRAPVSIEEKAQWNPGPDRQLWRIENFSPLGFVPRTAQLVSSCFTDCSLSRLHLFYIQIYNCKTPHTEGTLVHSAVTLLPFRYLFIILKKIFKIVSYLKIRILILTMKYLCSWIRHRC